ncbi:hypothetical protein F3Y22_tig00111708pilonHSYRG00519 [Hibiscus syriacus]|uniref:Uncharacterized protein n=1 Tax=Hibiscus syriacus TaxID=106335 RepID=A0A6A2XGC2_HIBSY|nr:hypothetical protein F3Y22_tig00111708pilonHSYRG00519 [Hibiscus syriacus]
MYCFLPQDEKKNDLTGSSLDLEEMCCEYLAMSDPSGTNLNKLQLHDIQGDGNRNSDRQVDNDSTITKKKKKSGNDILDNIAGQSDVDDKSVNSKKIEVSDAGIENKTRDKKKKENKLTSDSLVEGAAYGSEDTQVQHAATISNANDTPLEDKTSKSKKMKKDEYENVEKGKSKDDKNKISKVDSTVADDKNSKRRKKETTEEQLNSLVGADKHVGKGNGNIEKNGKHSEQKSSKKQQNGLAQTLMKEGRKVHQADTESIKPHRRSILTTFYLVKVGVEMISERINRLKHQLLKTSEEICVRRRGHHESLPRAPLQRHHVHRPYAHLYHVYFPRALHDDYEPNTWIPWAPPNAHDIIEDHARKMKLVTLLDAKHPPIVALTNVREFCASSMDAM